MNEQNQNKNIPVQEEEGVLQTTGAFVWDLFKILIIAALIIWPFRTFVAEPFVVSGSSMLPNFSNHDYLIVDRLSYITGEPKRGDAIVLRFPKDPSQYFIKRIIGLPGEKVCFSATCQGQDGNVYVFNGQHPEGFKLTESYVSKPTYGVSQAAPLGSGEYYVLGDNRDASSDSRVWGILPKDDIIGKVWARVYPFSTAGFFDTPTYQ
jgi:signal peptidase I